MGSDKPLFIVLAAGKGTRMRSDLPKVMHKIAGRSILAHVLELAKSSPGAQTAVVVGPAMEKVRDEAVGIAPLAEVFVQRDQRGTADAVLAARSAIEAHDGDVIVMYADTPLLRANTLDRLKASLASGANVAVLGFRAADPTGYGRLLTSPGGELVAIREEKDASPQEREIVLCNSGIMAFRMPRLAELLSRIGNTNAKQEFYLTDAVELARAAGLSAVAVECDEDEVLGINSRDQLAVAEAIWQRRAREALMRDGVTMIAPETVWLSYDTRIARDVVLEPNVFFGPGVSVEQGAEIKAFSHIEGATIGKGARIGPFARLRPGARLSDDVHIGNFVEVKNVAVGQGAKANHLSYLGDGEVGARANIGAGTIFCNYDGFLKHKTRIGEGAFVGSNTSLVAPVSIGDGAYVGSGSVITRDVAAGALGLERSKQEERPGWAQRFREMTAKRKAAKR